MTKIHNKYADSFVGLRAAITELGSEGLRTEEPNIACKIINHPNFSKYCSGKEVNKA